MKAFQASAPLAGQIPGDVFSNRVYALREHLGLSRKDFAQLTGLSISQVGRLERGGHGTRGDQPTCQSIALACGVRAVWLYAGSNSPQSMWPDWWSLARKAA